MPYVGVKPAEITSSTEAQIDNIKIDGNTVSSTDTNGNIAVTPDGTGSVVIDGLSHPQSDGSAGQFLKTDGSGNLSFGSVTTSGAYDLNGEALTLDADGDTKITADTDDRVDFDVAGTANVLQLNTTNLLHSNGRFGRDSTDYIQFNGTVCKIFLDGSERARFNTSGALLLDSENGSNLIVDARQGSAKHWVNIDIEGTVSTLDSYNHTSFSDNGTGNVTINFNNDMNNSGYSVSTMSRAASDATPYVAASFGGNVRSTSQVKIQFAYGNASTTAFHDVPYSGTTTHGDLA
jgi:hypothetical protein